MDTESHKAKKLAVDVYAPAFLMASALVYFLIRTIELANRPSGFDLTSYLLSAQALLNGTDPYSTGSAFPYIYPLLLAALLTPLSLLPYNLTVVLWFGGSVAAMVYAVCLVTPRSSHTFRRPVWMYAAWFALVAFIIQNELQNGQVNSFVLLLCVLSINHRDHANPWYPALFLSLAAGIKILPVLLFAPLLVRRRWAILSRAAVLSLLFVVLPALVASYNVKEYIVSYVERLSAHSDYGWMESIQHGAFHSVAGLLAWLLPLELSTTAWKALGAVVILVTTVVIDKRSRARMNRGEENSTFALYMLTLVLASPMSETHHLVLAFPALLLLWFHGGAKSPMDRIGGMVTVILFTALAYMQKWSSALPWSALGLLLVYVETARRVLRAGRVPEQPRLASGQEV